MAHAYNKNVNTRSAVFDYLRIFAMLGVLAVHFSQQFPIPFVGLKSVMSLGANCVQVFFVISAYLACFSFAKKTASVSGYYKKRALRILPTYYAAIVAAMVYVELFTDGYSSDAFHLGWIRYFLALNTILPSTNFDQWNNTFGFWTMTDFIFFYALFPFLIKYFHTVRRCFFLFLICLVVERLSVLLGTSLAQCTNYSKMSLLIEWSPLGQMVHFALGMMTYFAVLEKKKSCVAVFLIAFCMIVVRPFWKFPMLISILIMFVHEPDVAIQGWKQKLVQCVSKYSFHIYLTHLLALAVGGKLALLFAEPSTSSFFITKFLVFVIFTFILSAFLEMAQRIANRMFAPRNTGSSSIFVE